MVSIADEGRIDLRRIGKLGERREHDALFTEALDAVGERFFVDDPVGEAELVLERCGRGRCQGCRSHRPSLASR